MMKEIDIKKRLAENWFSYLQLEICNQFQKLENSSKGIKKSTFVKREWRKEDVNEGGGTSYLLLDGSVFDKVGVNKSTVSGNFKKEFRKNIPGAEKNGNYWASGISVVAHMKNPKIPAIHFNTRFIVTSKFWFGGGIDVTPSSANELERKIIHKKLKQICIINKKSYYKYKKWCEKYFFIPHRNEQRGIGGIFFDYEMSNWEKNFKFVRDLGLEFINITNYLIGKKEKLKWSTKEKKRQLLKRGRYVEFNLLYDRGTKFGLNSGGNIESILMSIPPNAKWN